MIERAKGLVGGGVMGGMYSNVCFRGVSAESCCNALQYGIDCSEWQEIVNRDINDANM